MSVFIFSIYIYVLDSVHSKHLLFFNLGSSSSSSCLAKVIVDVKKWEKKKKKKRRIEQLMESQRRDMDKFFTGDKQFVHEIAFCA